MSMPVHPAGVAANRFARPAKGISPMRSPSRAKVGLGGASESASESASASAEMAVEPAPLHNLGVKPAPARYAADADMNSFPIVDGNLGEFRAKKPKDPTDTAIARARRANRRQGREGSGSAQAGAPRMTKPRVVEDEGDDPEGLLPPMDMAPPPPPPKAPKAPTMTIRVEEDDEASDDPDGVLPPAQNDDDDEEDTTKPALKVLKASCPFCATMAAAPIDPNRRICHITCHGCEKMFGIATPTELLSPSARPLSARIFRPMSARPSSARSKPEATRTAEADAPAAEPPADAAQKLKAICPFCDRLCYMPVDGSKIAHGKCGGCNRIFGAVVPLEMRPESARRPMSARLGFGGKSSREASARQQKPGEDENAEPKPEPLTLKAECPFCKSLVLTPIDPKDGSAHATCGGCERMFKIAVPKHMRPDSARRTWSARAFSARSTSARSPSSPDSKQGGMYPIGTGTEMTSSTSRKSSHWDDDYDEKRAAQKRPEAADIS